MDICLPCSVSAGELEVPGGFVYESKYWVADHCVGPLGLGTWILKPRRHVTSVGDLDEHEATELGPALVLVSRVAGELIPCEQVYNELWSHAGDPRGHIHYVISAVTTELRERFGKGPNFHAAMFAAREEPDADAVVGLCDAFRARVHETGNRS